MKVLWTAAREQSPQAGWGLRGYVCVGPVRFYSENFESCRGVGHFPRYTTWEIGQICYAHVHAGVCVCTPAHTHASTHTSLSPLVLESPHDISSHTSLVRIFFVTSACSEAQQLCFPWQEVSTTCPKSQLHCLEPEKVNRRWQCSFLSLPSVLWTWGACT